jgi:hypothetical protein
MMHSIIIPHRRRLAHLRACLASIERSAEVTGIRDFEVIVAHGGPVGHEIDMAICQAIGPVCPFPEIRVIEDLDHPELFNKCRLLNLGMRHAQGLILTFLDADAIVGPRWLEGAPTLHASRSTLTRLCYRVRYLAECWTVDCAPFWTSVHFANYDGHPRAWEAYTNPGNNCPEGKEPTPGCQPVFGNSQFSIRRDTLEELATVSEPSTLHAPPSTLLLWDEAFAGRGLEDLDMIQRIWQAAERTPDGYSAEILTDPDHAMFHLRHGYDADWDPVETRDDGVHHTATEANSKRYRERHR